MNLEPRGALRLLAARWVFPVAAAPIRDGAVVTRGDTILAVGRQAELVARFGAALGRDQWIGSLEPGKRADLVAVDGWSVYDRDPVGSLIDQSRASSVRLTMVDGVVRYRRPEVPICP